MSLPYFPMYPSDFEAKTSHLTIAEDGAYNRLIRICWMTAGCSMPADEEWVMRRARAHSEQDRAAVLAILEEFFTVENGRYSNARLAREFSAANDAHERRKVAGSKGGKAKSLKINKTAPSKAVAKPKQPEPEPEPDKEIDTNVSIVRSPNPVPANDVSEAVSAYNETASQAGWPQVQRLNPQRSKKLKARIKEVGGIHGFRDALAKASASDFLTGRTNNPWTGFGFDWLIKPENFTKLMEGNYDNRSNNSPAPSGNFGNGQRRDDPAIADALRLAGIG